MISYTDKSNCHNALVYRDGKTIYYYVCTKCGCPCDLQPLKSSRTNTVGLGEYSDADLIAELIQREYPRNTPLKEYKDGYMIGDES